MGMQQQQQAAMYAAMGGNAGQMMMMPYMQMPMYTRMALPSEMMEEQPTYVNAKQYRRIITRRQARAKLESRKKIPTQRKNYLHESRHKHACRRPRGPGGRFLTKEELEEFRKRSAAGMSDKEAVAAAIAPTEAAKAGGDSSGTNTRAPATNTMAPAANIPEQGPTEAAPQADPSTEMRAMPADVGRTSFATSEPSSERNPAPNATEMEPHAPSVLQTMPSEQETHTSPHPHESHSSLSSHYEENGISAHVKAEEQTAESSEQQKALSEQELTEHSEVESIAEAATLSAAGTMASMENLAQSSY